jgi:segregation and condensation protein B
MPNDNSSVQNNPLTAKIEALLFTYGDPVTIKKISSILSINESEVEAGLEALKTLLNEADRGLVLVEQSGKVQMVTKPEFSGFLENIVKSEFTDNLTPATLEALSIICYTAPVTRAEIDYIRGVNSSFILRNLTLRGLIDRETDSGHGHAYVYSPSFDLVKYLGLARTEDLPEFERFRDLIRKFHEGQLEGGMSENQDSEILENNKEISDNEEVNE